MTGSSKGKSGNPKLASLASIAIVWALVLLGCGGGDSVAGFSPASGQPVFSFPTGEGGMLISPGFDAVEGNMFQVIGGSNILVTALGFEYERPYQLPAPTAIFDGNGTVLASALISSTDPLSGGYYWKKIDPVTLYSGSQYYIGSLHGTGSESEYIWNTRTASVPSYMVDLGTYFKVSSTIAGGSWQFGGGTSQYGPGEIRHYVGNFQTRPAP